MVIYNQETVVLLTFDHTGHMSTSWAVCAVLLPYYMLTIHKKPILKCQFLENFSLPVYNTAQIFTPTAGIWCL